MTYEIKVDTDSRFSRPRIRYYVLRDGAPVLARGGWILMWKTHDAALAWVEKQEQANA